MRFSAEPKDIRTAIDRIKLDLDDKNNTFKSITLLADETGAGVFATDSVAYVESRFAATVEEMGQCQIARTLGPILANVRDDRVDLSLTKSKLVIEGSNGFKGRLQNVAGQAVAYEVVGEKIANIIANNLQIPINTNSLQRIKFKKPQANLKKTERIKNINQAFAWQDTRLNNQNIILIDDVTTTGATLNECAKILKANGANKVWGLVLANG